MSSFSCVPALPAAEKALTASGMTLLFVAWVAPIWALPLDPFSTFFANLETVGIKDAGVAIDIECHCNQTRGGIVI